MIDIVLIFGDSITWGADDQEFLGWAARLRKYLQSVSENSAVYNCGIRGDTTAGLLARFDVEANARKTRDGNKETNAIVFAIGINDSRTVDDKSQTVVEEFRNNLETLIEKAKSITDNIFFIGLTKVVDAKANWIDDRGHLAYINKQVQEYDNVIKQVAKDKNLFYLEMYNVLEDTDLPEDGLHPDANGHEKMFEVIRDFLKPHLGIS